MTIYSLDILLFQFGTSLFHVQFYLLLLELHTDFSGGRSGGLVFSSLSEFSTVCCNPHIGISLKSAQGQCLPTQFHLCKVKEKEKKGYTESRCGLASRDQTQVPRLLAGGSLLAPGKVPSPRTLLGNCSQRHGTTCCDLKLL